MEKYQQMIARMELTEDMKAKKLSSGMMAKLKIAVTMARKAKIYLLDEPLNGIDLLARDEIMKSILEAVDPDDFGGFQPSGRRAGARGRRSPFHEGWPSGRTVHGRGAPYQPAQICRRSLS